MIPPWLAGLALAGSSIFVFPDIGDTIREPKWMWLWASALLGLFFVRRIPRLPLLVLPFFAYALIQPYFFSPARLVWPFTAGLLALFVLAVWAPAPHPALRKFLAVATLLQWLMVALQYLDLDPLFAKMRYADDLFMTGFLGQHTVLGAWLAPLACFWLAHRRWWLGGISAALACATLSAFTILGLASGLLAWAWWRRPKWALAITALAFLGALAGLASGRGVFYDNGRFNMWPMILWAARDRPWFGYGMDSFSRLFPRLQGLQVANWIQAHSEPLELLFGGGRIGVALAALLFLPLWQNRKNWWGKEEYLPWFLVLVAVLANSLGNFPLHIAPIALFAAMAYFRLVQAPK